MKKITFLLLAACAVVCFNAQAQKKVAYVTSLATPTDAGDVAVLAKLRGTYTVDIIVAAATADAALPASTFDPYDAVVLAALPGSGNVPTSLKGINKPFVNLKVFQLQSSRWNWGNPINCQSETANGIDVAAKSIAVKDKTHPIFNGISYSGANNDEVLMATSSNEITTGGKTYYRIMIGMAATDKVTAWISDNGSKIINLANVANYTDTYNTEVCSISEIPVGSVITDGAGGTVTIAKKYIQIGVSEAAAAFLTPEYLTIVKNSVDYVLAGTTDIKTADAASKVAVSKEYVDVTGKKVYENAKGFVIVRTTYEDGSFSTEKLFNK